MSATAGLSLFQLFTLSIEAVLCGSIEPGIAASATKSSKRSAVFMLVSWRQFQRRKPQKFRGGSGVSVLCFAEICFFIIRV
jgi:hypothetical protein